jgi:hypothetical protein
VVSNDTTATSISGTFRFCKIKIECFVLEKQNPLNSNIKALIGHRYIDIFLVKGTMIFILRAGMHRGVL